MSTDNIGETDRGYEEGLPDDIQKHIDNTPLQPVKESAMDWLKKEGYPNVMPMTLDNLGIILDRYTKQLSSPPEPSSKEQEAVGLLDWMAINHYREVGYDKEMKRAQFAQFEGNVCCSDYFSKEQLYQLYKKKP